MTRELLLHRPSKAQHISVVVDDLKGPESVMGIGQLPMHGNLLACELCVECVGIFGVDVGVPRGPFVTRMIRLRMDLRRDGLDHEHDAVASHDGPEVISGSVASAFIENVEPQLGLIERKRSGQVVDNKKGSNRIQHSATALGSNIARRYSQTFIVYAERLAQSRTDGWWSWSGWHVASDKEKCLRL
jgi:hypothetical protein